VAVTRFHAPWSALFTSSKQKLIVILYQSYLLLSNKDSVRAEKSQADNYKSDQISARSGLTNVISYGIVRKTIS
jgi:hypothetical protein